MRIQTNDPQVEELYAWIANERKLARNMYDLQLERDLALSDRIYALERRVKELEIKLGEKR